MPLARHLPLSWYPSWGREGAHGTHGANTDSPNHDVVSSVVLPSGLPAVSFATSAQVSERAAEYLTMNDTPKPRPLRGSDPPLIAPDIFLSVPLIESDEELFHDLTEDGTEEREPTPEDSVLSLYDECDRAHDDALYAEEEVTRFCNLFAKSSSTVSDPTPPPLPSAGILPTCFASEVKNIAKGYLAEIELSSNEPGWSPEDVVNVLSGSICLPEVQKKGGGLVCDDTPYQEALCALLQTLCGRGEGDSVGVAFYSCETIVAPPGMTAQHSPLLNEDAFFSNQTKSSLREIEVCTPLRLGQHTTADAILDMLGTVVLPKKCGENTKTKILPDNAVADTNSSLAALCGLMGAPSGSPRSALRAVLHPMGLPKVAKWNAALDEKVLFAPSLPHSTPRTIQFFASSDPYITETILIPPMVVEDDIFFENEEEGEEEEESVTPSPPLFGGDHLPRQCVVRIVDCGVEEVGGISGTVLLTDTNPTRSASVARGGAGGVVEEGMCRAEAVVAAEEIRLRQNTAEVDVCLMATHLKAALNGLNIAASSPPHIAARVCSIRASLARCSLPTDEEFMDPIFLAKRGAEYSQRTRYANFTYKEDARSATPSVRESPSPRPPAPSPPLPMVSMQQPCAPKAPVPFVNPTTAVRSLQRPQMEMTTNELEAVFAVCREKGSLGFLLHGDCQGWGENMGIAICATLQASGCGAVVWGVPHEHAAKVLPALKQILEDTFGCPVCTPNSPSTGPVEGGSIILISTDCVAEYLSTPQPPVAAVILLGATEYEESVSRRPSYSGSLLRAIKGVRMKAPECSIVVVKAIPEERSLLKEMLFGAKGLLEEGERLVVFFKSRAACSVRPIPPDVNVLRLVLKINLRHPENSSERRVYAKVSQLLLRHSYDTLTTCLSGLLHHASVRSELSKPCVRLLHGVLQEVASKVDPRIGILASFLKTYSDARARTVLIICHNAQTITIVGGRLLQQSDARRVAVFAGGFAGGLVLSRVTQTRGDASPQAVDVVLRTYLARGGQETCVVMCSVEHAGRFAEEMQRHVPLALVVEYDGHCGDGSAAATQEALLSVLRTPPSSVCSSPALPQTVTAMVISGKVAFTSLRIGLLSFGDAYIHTLLPHAMHGQELFHPDEALLFSTLTSGPNEVIGHTPSTYTGDTAVWVVPEYDDDALFEAMQNFPMLLWEGDAPKCVKVTAVARDLPEESRAVFVSQCSAVVFEHSDALEDIPAIQRKIANLGAIGVTHCLVLILVNGPYPTTGLLMSETGKARIGNSYVAFVSSHVEAVRHVARFAQDQETPAALNFNALRTSPQRPHPILREFFYAHNTGIFPLFAEATVLACCDMQSNITAREVASTLSQRIRGTTLDSTQLQNIEAVMRVLCSRNGGTQTRKKRRTDDGWCPGDVPPFPEIPSGVEGLPEDAFCQLDSADLAHCFPDEGADGGCEDDVTDGFAFESPKEDDMLLDEGRSFGPQPTVADDANTDFFGSVCTRFFSGG